MKRLAIIITTIFALTAAASAESDPKKVEAILEGAKVCNATADPVACMTGFMAALGIEPAEEKAAEVVVESSDIAEVVVVETKVETVLSGLSTWSDSNICSFATKLVNGSRAWSTAKQYSKYVKEAKSRNLDCKDDESSLAHIPDDQICLGYRGSFSKYVDEAKKRDLNCVATVTEDLIFVSLTSKIILFKVQSAHTNFEISRSNSKRNSKFDPKFDLSDLVDASAISDKPIQQIESVINVSNPEFYALSSHTSLELITTTVIEIQAYLCISYVFILKRLPW